MQLRRRLAAGLAQSRLNQTQLAARAGLGRTTVSEALSSRKPVPSAQTVAALARGLQLPVEELLALQRDAAAEAAGGGGAGGGGGEWPGPGRLIGEWDPHDLEVHPAGYSPVAGAPDAPGKRVLSGYVRREHDQVLAEAVRDATAGRSRILILVGSSSTGKTRACWEAVQPLADQGWRLWHPFDPTRAEAALDELHQVRPCTVVWLNEAQHYLGDRTVGEQVAAAVHHLLVSPERKPVLVLGTLWPEYARQYTALPTPGTDDPYSRARELLTGHTLSIPESFDGPALTAAVALAESGDLLLADALTRTGSGTEGRVTQDLAGAPELLRRFRYASPPARALLEAAMDARRLGVGLHLPQAFLTDAAPDYVGQHDYDQLTDDWAEAAYAELAAPVHGRQAPRRRTTPRPPRRPPTPSTAPPFLQVAGPVFRLADYLEQHGRITRKSLCPPASFWHAAHTHLTHPDDLDNLAREASVRHRLQWAHHLQHRAADRGSANALAQLAQSRERGGDREGAETLARQAADHGDASALRFLAEIRERAGDREGAETLAEQAADHGDASALRFLAEIRERAGDREGAETLAEQAAHHGNTYALYGLAVLRERAGDEGGAEILYRQAANHGSTNALTRLAVRREQVGDQTGAETLARQGAVYGNFDVLVRLAVLREQAGDQGGAEILYRQAADHGSIDALVHLAVQQEGVGDRESAEFLARQAADRGSTAALIRLAEIREGVGDRESAEFLARQAADRGNAAALIRLAKIREGVGDRESAEILARRAVDHGNTYALYGLAALREQAGDQEGAETLYPRGC